LKMAVTPYEIIGTDMSPNSSGLAIVDKGYLVPPARDPSYVDVLLRLCRKHSIRALFPGSEAELKTVSANEEAIRSAGVFLPINRASVIDLCTDKNKASGFLASEGFSVPESRQVRSERDALEFGLLPAVLKPSLGSGGSADVFLVQDEEMLRACSRHLLQVHGEFIIQAYVGTPEAEFTVGVLHDMDGGFLNSIAVRRFILSALGNRIKVPNRTAREDLGKTLAISSGISQGEIGPFPEVAETCERVARKLGSRGPLNIQCRRVGDKVVIFEINPRFSGTSSLRAIMGFNEPDILVRKHLLGEATPARFAYQSGVVMRGLSETLVRDPRPERAE
jgi:carbamoyl-phosphate synthase large subunit